MDPSGGSRGWRSRGTRPRGRERIPGLSRQLASGISTPMGHLVSVRSTCHASAPSRYFCCLRRSFENKSAVTKGIYAYSYPLYITQDLDSLVVSRIRKKLLAIEQQTNRDWKYLDRDRVFSENHFLNCLDLTAFIERREGEGREIFLSPSRKFHQLSPSSNFGRPYRPSRESR